MTRVISAIASSKNAFCFVFFGFLSVVTDSQGVDRINKSY